jgi:hypothetical protein
LEFALCSLAASSDE